MIAKRVQRNQATSSAAGLVRYIVGAQGELDPRSWARTADYILAARPERAGGERVASVRVTNCGTDDPGDAAIIIEATQAANTRSRTDKTYHLLYSFPPGETPKLEVLHAIEDQLCAAIGYSEHQRISAVHVDTDHLHVHVAINKVHPTGLQNIEPYYDKHRLMKACERIEMQYGLTRTNHGLAEGIAHETATAIALAAEQGHDSRFRAYLRQSYHLALAEPPTAQTYDGLRILSSRGMAHAVPRYTLLLPGDARHRLDQGGTQQSDGLRRARDGAGIAQRGIKGNAMEAHAGVESLIGYVAREAAPAMRQAKTWQALHASLAEHGLEIKPRGAGLVIGDAQLGLWCKASHAGRDLSIQALSERLGPYEPAQGRTSAPAKRYVPRPRQPHPASAALYGEYQRQRQAALQNRKQGLAALRAEQAGHRATLRQWAATQRAIVKASTRGPIRHAWQASLRAQLAAARGAHATVAAGKRQALIAATTLPTWNAWLMLRAENGDVEALDVLRSRAERTQQLRGDSLSATQATGAKTVILATVKTQVRKDGALRYVTADGGLVVDRATHIEAPGASAGAALVAVSLAGERFQGEALEVRGSAQFRADVARLAGLHRIGVHFADPAMEAMKQAATPAPRPQRTHQTQPDTATAKDPVSPSILAWIAARNATRDRVSSIDYHRPWTGSDAGLATYQGRRRMTDGSEVVLLKRADEVLVKPVGPRVAAQASRWRIGARVTLDARGRFLGKDRGIEDER